MSEPIIVVALDGSELAEAAVPYALTVAKASGAGLLLVVSWEGPERAFAGDLPDLADDFSKLGEEHYRSYLSTVAEGVKADGVEADTEVCRGKPAQEIMRVLEQRDPRLLVMATHGRSGLSRWVYGSVASTLIREAPVPTMVVGPKALAGGPPKGAIRKILVPLDGSPLAESALRPALELADALDASLVLAQVLRWASQAMASGVPDIDVGRLDRELTEAAQEYLNRAKGRLRTDKNVDARVLRGPPAEALIDLVEAEGIDIVVMASHTRGGLARAALGSMADRMLQGRAPVLLVSPERTVGLAHAPRGRYCHNCRRAVIYGEVAADDRCIRCGQHLHVCANCVYFDGITCLLQRSEVHDTYPGQRCQEFQYRETAAAERGGD